MENLSIWESVQKTDPKYTKEFSAGGGFSGTSINAVYMIKQATEKFGPVGYGWGYDILEERYDEGGPLSTDPLILEKIHTIKIQLWYQTPDGKAELVHYGHTPYVFKNKYGIQTDKEAPKKSLTDAIKKALSMLGFSADVFMGMYDDLQYLNDLRYESEVNSAVNKVEEKEKQAKEQAAWLDEQIKLMKESVSISMLQGVYKSAHRKLAVKNDQTGLKRLERVKDEVKTTLEQKEAS